MVKIYEIQGEGHTSPLLGNTVTAEGGIVTAVVDNGFYIQDPTGDGNNSTSDGLFIFLNAQPGVSVGDEVNVTGEVSEFQSGGEDNRNLTQTQIAFPDDIEVVSEGNDLPNPALIGEGGRIPPTETIDDDSFSEFNPTEDGIDFFESLEAMLVTAQDVVAVAPTNRFGEIFTVVDNGANATGISNRGTLNISPDDFNPEKVQIDFESDLLPDFDFPEVNVGAQLGDITGVISYSFGNFEILPTEEFTVTPSDLQPETTTLEAGEGQLTVASYNVLNLDPNDDDGDTDVADGRFTAIAEQIVSNLNTPDIIGLQEVQDNDGSEISDIGAADETLQLLIDEITAAGGPAYQFIDTPGIIPAFEDENGNTVRPTGGQPGGNIRNAFLYNSERVNLVEDSVEPLTDPQDQLDNPDNPFFGSRIPLSATFEFNGEEVTVISNHFSSKGGSSAILGLDQPFEELQNGAEKDLPQATLDELDPADRFVNGSYNEREAQAEAVKDYVDNLGSDNVIALGDFNEFEFVDPVQEILGSSLTNLVETLPEDERYSFIFQGNSQQLDHILVSDNLAEQAQFDIVHSNAEFPDTPEKASDHEPLLASVNLSQENNMAVNLNPIGTFQTGVFDEGAAEIVAYDAGTQRLFVINSDAVTVDILNVSDPTNPTLIDQIDATEFGDGANSVAVKDGIVAVAIEAEAIDANGQIVFFDTDGNVLNTVEAGVLPDMVTFSPDGTKVLVANEGEPNDDYTIDPEGSVSVIDISEGVENATVSNAGFTQFNDQKVALMNRGVRIFGPNATVAQDVEPEYITFNADSTTAYVSLQENNALAVVDLESAEVLDILPLGFKDHSQGLPTLETFDLNDDIASQRLQTPDGASDIPLGGLSGLFFEGTTDDGELQFITHPDRGPDLGTTETTRIFELPDFQPSLYRFNLNPETGEVTFTETIGLTRADGTPLTGLPNLEGDDGGRQGENADGELLDFDPFGADMEGVVVAGDGTFWTVDEYRPSIYHFDTDGTLIDRYVPAGTDPDTTDDITFGSETLPEAYLSARDNRGFEAIAQDPESGTVYAFIQTPLGNDGTGEFNRDVSDDSQVIRILGIDPTNGQPVAEYVYLLEKPAFSEGNIDKIGDAVYAGDGKFFVIERDSGTNPTSGKAIYEINLSGATNVLGQTLEGTTLEQLDADGLAAEGIRAVSKVKVTNLPSLGYLPSDKPEGLALLDDGSLAVINDNDFEPENKDTSLGIISFNKSNQLDASDEDGINFQNIPSFGMLQPDSIDAFEVDGQTFIITANEGDARDFDGFSEEAGLDDLLEDGLLDLNDDNTADTGETVISTGETVNDLLAEDRLGELDFTNATGDIDGDGLIEQLHNFGGRSFSVFDEFGNLVFDSGDEFERIVAEQLPDDFNSDNDENDSFDSRSDAKGPEPEAVVTGEVDGTLYAFVGLERVGGIMVYNISNPSEPEFVQYVNNRDFTVDLELEDGTTNPEVGDLGPEGFEFISAEDSPNGEPLLAVGNEVSGTTTIYSVADVAQEETQVLRSFNPETDDPIALVEAILQDGANLTIVEDSISFTGGFIPEDEVFSANSGDAPQTAFYDGSLDLNIGSGILLTSGDATPPLENTEGSYSVTQNGNADSDLQAVADNAFEGAGEVQDANLLEFSFTVDDPNVTSVSFDLVFGSDEFPEFSDSSFVDIAAVFVNGDNAALFNNEENQPLSVISQNLSLGNFIDNESTEPLPNNFGGETRALPIEYDGVSGALTIFAPVNQGTNTVKIGVGDTGDTILDSGLFVSNFTTRSIGNGGDSDGGGSGVLIEIPGTPGDDDITGTDNNEFIETFEGNDLVDPGGGNDVIDLGAGNDTFIGGNGDNNADGGDGEDTAVYSGPFAEEQIEIVDENTIRVGDSTDTLNNFEFLQFDDQTVEIASLEETFTLQLLHAADQEGGLPAVEDAVNFSAVIEALAEQSENTLRISSGDIYIPGPFFNASSELYGEPGIGDILINNALGFQAVTFGNHEFDQGTEVIRNLIEANPEITGPGIGEEGYQGTAFPYLSTNLDFSEDANLSDLVVEGGQAPQPNTISSSTVIDVNGEQIGVVGATTPTLEDISSPGDVIVQPTNDEVEELAAIIQEEVDALTDQGINKIILSAHFQQLSIEEEVASLLDDVDIVIAGGSNTLLANEDDPLRDGDTAEGSYPIEVDSDGETVYLVNTDGNYKYVGQLIADFDAEGNVISIGDDSGAFATDIAGVERLLGEGADPAQFADATIVEVTNAIGDLTLEADGNVFGLTEVFLNGTRGDVRTQETNLGNLTADANLEITNQLLSEGQQPATISLKNAGGIRDNIGSAIVPAGGTSGDLELLPPQANPAAGKEEGEISQLDIENALRFNNGLVQLTLTLEELELILEHAVEETEEGATPGRFPQVSGVNFSFDAEQTPIEFEFDTDGNNTGEVATDGERIREITILDEAGEELTIFEDGEFVVDPSQEVRIVTLNFLADGGDGFPFDVFGENPIDFVEEFGDNTNPDNLPEGTTNEAEFAAVGSEQDALAEFLAQNFPVDGDVAFSEEDTPATEDDRIINLAEQPPEVERPEPVFGSLEDDNLEPDDDNQLVFTGAGDDLVDASIASAGSRIYGGSGADELFASSNSRLFGGAGDDILDGSLGNGGNRLYGDAGDDDFFLGGSDRVVGGEGSDRFFVLSEGNNLITGGADADQFWIVNAEFAAAANTITDFTTGEDVFGIAGVDLAFADLTIEASGENPDNTVIGTDTQDLAILLGVEANTITESDFVFA